MAPIMISSAAPGKKAAPKAPARRRPAAAAPAVLSTPAPSAQQTTPSVAPPSPTPTQQSAVERSTAEQEREGPPRSEHPAQSQQGPQSAPAPVEPVRQASPGIQQTRSGPPNVQHAPISVPTVQPTPQPTKDTVPDPAAETTQSAASSANQPNQPSREQVREESGATREEPVLSFAEQALGPLLLPIPGQPNQEEPVSQQQREGASNAATSTTTEPANTKQGTKRARFQEDGPPTQEDGSPKRQKRSTARSNARVQAVVQGEEQAGEQIRVRAGRNDASGEAVTTADPAPAKKRRATARKVTTTQRRGRSKAKSAETITNSDDEGEGANVPEQETQIDPALTGEDPSSAPAAPKPKKATKPRKARVSRKKVQTSAQNSAEPVASENVGTEMDIDPHEPTQQEGDGESSDLEDHVIDPSVVTMWDISRDSRHGKRSERGKAMAAIDWAKIKADRKAAAQAIVDGLQQPKPADASVRAAEGVVPTTEGAEEANGTPVEDARDPDAEPSEQPATETAEPDAQMGDDDGGGVDEGPQFRMDENGDIVIDQEKTVTIDNTQAARDAAANVEDAEVVDDLTVLNNRTTWINDNRRDPIDRVPLWKWKSDPWSEDDTDRFYDQLRMFGTDFFVISKMFPGRNRRMIKAKFTREEKLDPARVDAALSGKSTGRWNLEHYARETGVPVAHYERFQTLEHTMSIINEETQKKHENQAAEEERKAAEREKEEREKAAAEKEKRKSAKKAKRTRQKAAAAGTLGGGGRPDD